MVNPSTRGGLSRTVIWREQIVEAARAVIEESGPDALPVQIAERAGLARCNLYRHFASKGELDFAVARSAYRELRDAMRAELHLCNGPLDVIRAPIAAQVVWADIHPNLYRFLVIRSYQRRSQRLEPEQREFTAEVAAAGAEYFPYFAESHDTVAVLIARLRGLVNASILDWVARRTETREQLIESLTTQAWLLVDYHLQQKGVNVDPAVPLPQVERTGG